MSWVTTAAPTTSRPMAASTQPTSAAWSRARFSPAARRTRRTRRSSSAAATWPRGRRCSTPCAGSSSANSASRSCSTAMARNTTAAAAVAWLAHGRSLAGKRAVVLAGTGPVGQRAAALLASEGAAVAITGRKLDVVQAACRGDQVALRRGGAADRGRDHRRARRGHRGRADRARHRRGRHHAARGHAVADQPDSGARGGCQRLAACGHRRRVDGRSRHAEPRQDLVRAAGIRRLEARVASRLYQPPVRAK